MANYIRCPICQSENVIYLSDQVERIGGNKIFNCSDCLLSQGRGDFLVSKEFNVPIVPRWYIVKQFSISEREKSKQDRKDKRKEKKLKNFLLKKGVIIEDQTEAVERFIE